ncbi:properdin-like isoform X1 [Mobula birostris]|uniref:properdin-like isoform X1 n=2 Tax=Mobula birostris TaxID=1983395 RepID=UPI003B281E2F
MASGNQAPGVSLAYLLLLALYPSPTDTANVRCYTAMDRNTFTCTDLIADNIKEEDCCLNPNYCFQRNSDGKSVLCRPVSDWSEWTQWSRCSVTCAPGVQQRRRACLGIRECHKEEALQAQPCVEKPCCQKDGGWSAWSPWSPCSVTCHTGRQKRERSCSEPPPSCGGGCPGARESYRDCDTNQICPTHGSWSSWGPWGLCSRTCKPEGSGAVPTRQRRRTCSNPPPSVNPPGRMCQGNTEDNSLCQFLPFCPVPGNWGPWVKSGPCPVSCGIGKVTYRRSCDKPAPRHGGAYCSGSDNTLTVCNTDTHCPVDGLWTMWGRWSYCRRRTFNISCNEYPGQQKRTRYCLGRNHGGQPCHGSIIDVRSCYDAEGCFYGKGVWTDWGGWGLCKPACGEGSVQSRKRSCEPTYPPYAKQRGEVEQVPVVFSGEPRYYCEQLDGQEWEVVQTKPCHNVPACD